MLPGDDASTGFDLYRSANGGAETKLNDTAIKGKNNWQVFVDNRATAIDFSRQTWLPVAVTKDGRKTIDGLRPTIWHRLNEGDQIIKNRNFEKGVGPDDAYPNKKAACILGVWNAQAMTGTRQARWLMLRNATAQHRSTGRWCPSRCRRSASPV